MCTPTVMTDISLRIASSLVAALHFLRIGELAEARHRVRREQVVAGVVARKFNKFTEYVRGVSLGPSWRGNRRVVGKGSLRPTYGTNEEESLEREQLRSVSLYSRALAVSRREDGSYLRGPGRYLTLPRAAASMASAGALSREAAWVNSVRACFAPSADL